MKRYLPYLIFLFLYFPVIAQKVEFGAGGGATFYKGDLQPTFRPLNPSWAGDIFVRYNFNRILSTKLNISPGEIKGNDSKSGNAFLKDRGFSFRHSLADIYLQLEYNFLNFRTQSLLYESDWTPYFSGGIGISRTFKSSLSANGNPILPTENFGGVIIPFGVGVKKIIGPRLNLSAEFITKVFLDKNKGAGFDGINSFVNQNLYSATINPNDIYTIPNTRQKDKYFHLSVTVSYLIYKVNCNTPGQKNTFF